MCPYLMLKYYLAFPKNFHYCILPIRKEQNTLFLVSKIVYFVPNNDSSRTFAQFSFKVKECAESNECAYKITEILANQTINCVLSDYMILV